MWNHHQRVFPTAALATLLCVFSAVHAAPTSLRAQTERMLLDEQVAGAVWATIDRDGTIRTGAAGVKNVVTGEPLRADSKMHVGSIAKTVLATGILHLASTGQLDLDAPVNRYLPTLRFDNPWPDHPVRVRHLLDHTAGLDDLRLWQMFSTQPTPDTPLHEAFVRDPSVLAIRSRPGSQFSYSNMSWTMAGMVIEAVTRERYEAWLDRVLLQPLGMRDSTFRFTTQVGPDADPRLAWGHHDIATPAPAVPVYLRPAGQFTTTARDLATFASFLLGDGRVDGRLLVAPSLLRAMGQPHTTDAARAGLRGGYALGLERRDRHGVVGLCHGGDVVGFHAMLCLFPDSDAANGGRAFVTVQNADGDGRNTGRFDALMIEALGLPRARKDRLPLPPPSDVADWEGRYVLAPNRMAQFAYVDFLFDSAKLAWDGHTLNYARGQRPVRTLTPSGGASFVADDRNIASHVLLAGANGERLISDGLRTYRQIHPAAYWSMVASLALGALGLAWFLLGVPICAVFGREPLRAPGVGAAALLVLPVPLFFLQSYTQLGERTAASVVLYAATAALPLLMLWQVWRSARGREGLVHGAVNLASALLVLQWCAVLAAWGMLPFALWR
ncbi:serine hydrolase [Lysobacter sp. F60174L2]|uniref:serine hydrolase n=1 Tax=Lysobacter sp. F60174L2 TaxID=3459295 RepID=UPI00403DBEA4